MTVEIVSNDSDSVQLYRTHYGRLYSRGPCLSLPGQADSVGCGPAERARGFSLANAPTAAGAGA